MRIDDMACIQHHHKLLYVEPTAAADRDRCAGRGDSAVRLDDRHAHALALREVGPETGLLLECLEHQLPVVQTLGHLEAPFERIPSARDSHLVDEDLSHETKL